MLRNIVSNEIFTILIIAGLAIVATAKLLAPKRFHDFMLVITNDRYLKIYARDQKFFDQFDALLFGNLTVSLSLFSLIIYRHITSVNSIPVNDMLKLLISIAVFILIKVLFERLIGSIFEIDKITDHYLFQKITFKNYLGVLLLPINAILLFSFRPTLPIIYGIIILLLIINTIGLISSFKTHQSLIKSNLFYFILYLCTLEIAPYIILYKVFVSQ
ncbi:DUF4271 domain-containing protein [Tamlana sp. 2_MG-2023]|uniref:DUF4271 domain-containing protein n=1 Tax=unclassified Tamlana TaxID=2614803 RepID=UPI0026E13AF8|nr:MULTISPECIES: DUF4271 domain-containing protein [unclassified Tamlana]MDO6760628.1 DUF4271 domain-containing protein [Tamlana sp. 2_MG-2023]MDO6790884.1 DUF4271 domain-containing protein [Tamlana sp. 1_MG-2023]